MPCHLLTETPLDQQTLREYFIQGSKTVDHHQIGVEWEKIGVHEETGKAIPYGGTRGVEAIFQGLIAQFGWEPVFSHQAVIGLRKQDSSITLEPGGQIELSGKKAAALDENARELLNHLSELKEISDPLRIKWLGTGMQPVSPVEAIEWVPKARYAIMRKSLSGSLAHAMMKQTASIQISLDYADETDAVEKLRLASALAPVLCALFANSPVSEGRLNGFHSRRAHIWKHTAPERSGLIPGVFDDDFGFDRYIDYALEVPMIFIVRQGEWVATPGLTFRHFMERGFGDYLPTLADWELHLTTIFTETRLKKYIEIRSIDCQKTQMGLAAPAFVKGLFYDESTRKSAWGRMRNLTLEERLELFEEAAVRGLNVRFKNGALLEIAKDLVKLAEAGLKRLAAGNPALQGETRYLEPLKELIRKGKNPAQIIIDRLSKNPAFPLTQLLSL